MENVKSIGIGSSNIPYLSELQLAFEMIYMINITSVITVLLSLITCNVGMTFTYDLTK